MNAARSLLLALILLPALHKPILAATSSVGSAPGDVMLSNYFRVETAKLASNCLAEIKTFEDWQSRRGEYRRQLFEMLGLSPLPERTPLKAVVTGVVEQEKFKVEKLHFQSLPGLYVTANLYLPKKVEKPAPAILYLSGHGPVISNGVSYGNKVAYQHHGAWFARNGYVCLILDTVELGEIQGLHHGTYREGMWWWNSRGYTPAGVEAWASIRALDYLETRAEVDANRVGATGRSGGGAYSWWIAALDDRVKAVAPVAGITDLQNHVVDGTVEGHCDCMFTVNTYRWDYAQVAALVAPRPLLIVNTDSDSIFPLDGVQRVHAQVRRVYGLHKALDKLGLVIGPGPHKDTQDLQVPVFRWFNRHLQGEDPIIEMAATKFFKPEQLKVFGTLPTDALNTNIHETFVPMAKVHAIPKSKQEWNELRDGWMVELKEKVFRGWPDSSVPLRVERQFTATSDGLTLEAFDFDSQPGVRLRFYCVNPAGQGKPGILQLHAANESQWIAWMDQLGSHFPGQPADELQQSAADRSPVGDDELTEVRRTMEGVKRSKMTAIIFAPRGVGLTALNQDARKQTQIRRRFMLLGQTLDAMRVWDIRRACQAVRAVPRLKVASLSLSGESAMAVNVIYASLFESGVANLSLSRPSKTHRAGPDYLNVLRVLDVPEALAMAAERAPVTIYATDRGDWDFPAGMASSQGWVNRLAFPLTK